MSSTNNQVNIGIGDSRDIQPWCAGVTYQEREEVEINNNIYIAQVNHVSTDFATDLAAVRWVAVSGGGGGGIELTDLSATNGLTYNNVTGQFKLGGTLIENTSIALDGFNTTFSNGANNLFHLDATNDRVGIGTNAPSYSLQVEAGDVFVKNGAFGLNESPDVTQRMRVTQGDSAGNNTTAVRVDHSYQTSTGNMSAIQVRSVPSKSGASSTLYGVNVSLGGVTSQVTAGTHKFVGLRSKIQFAAAGGSFTAYGLQIEDGTEGLNKVLTDVTGNGEINFVDVNTLVTGTNETLAEVLANGNITGGNNIILSDGGEANADVVKSESWNMQMDLNYGQTDNSYFIGSDPSGFTNSWIWGSESSAFEGNWLGYGVPAIAVKPQLAQGWQYDTPVAVVSRIGLGTMYGPISFDQSPVFVSTNNSSLSAGNTNTVIAGGSGIQAKVSGALYANVLRLQSTNNSFDGIFDIGTLTGDRTYSFPDVTGTIPSAPTLPSSNGQVTWLGTNGTLGRGGMRVSGQTMFPLNANTAALTNFGTSLGSAGFAFGQSYFQRTNAATGPVNGHRFYGSGIQARMWAAVGTGGGINIQPSNSKGGIRVSSQTEKGTIITNLGALAASAETSEHVTVQFSGRGITRHVGQTGTTIEGLTSFASIPDGSMIYINDATAAATFTSTGLWLKNGGTWEKLSS